jgi:2-polyprenyl-3-methyl-5-hydroxy-6-metoxy-1,4-benzoquinol methylase
MSSIKDEKGYNQSFVNTLAQDVRLKRRFDYMINQMNKPYNNPSEINVLEIGCARGEGLKYLVEKTGFKALGTDISTLFINEARKNNIDPNLSFEVVDFNDENTFVGGMEYAKYDYIIGNGILHHLYYNLDNSIISLNKLLKPGGKIIFIEPNLYNPYIYLIFKLNFLRKFANLEPDEMAFTDRFIEKLVLKSGFINCKVEIKDFLLPNIPKLLIKPSIFLGKILEKTIFTKIAQSIFLVAEK